MRLGVFVNELIQWNIDKDNTRTERILWVDTDNFWSYVIDINAVDSFPVPKRVQEIIDALEVGAAKKLDDDPFLRLTLDDEIKETDRNIREKAWAAISSLVASDKEPDIYTRDRRGYLVRNASQTHNITITTVYKYLRRYWQRGKNKNALLPDYFNSGGKGKSRKLGAKKVGRPRKSKSVIGEGRNVDEATKRIFRIAAKKYYDTDKQNFLTTAYNLMIKEFYAEDYVFENGVKKPVLIPEDQIPTITQFKYWCEKEQDIRKSLIARKGVKKYEMNHRAVLGKADSGIAGPGAKYQIDATIADVYLVSRYNKDWKIGRPVVYVVIDVFSRMVTGIYVGLEGPSWLGAMMALANMASDKVEFCKEYGIDITEADWPCHHLPEVILADRGELEGKMPETIINSLHMRVENTPSYRPDWKPIVEQHFRTLNIKVKPFLPGTIDVDYRERGSKDYRLDARINIRDFTKIIILSVLDHNNNSWMDNYQTDEEMISQGVRPIPIELWNWGIQNRSGRLRTYPEDVVKLNLMPTDAASVTESGIKFKNMRYNCERALKERWFEIARNKGSWKVNISYDPRNLDCIYIRSEDGRSFDKCTLLDEKRYSGKTLDEIVYLDEYEHLEKQKSRQRILQSKVDLIAEIENIVSKAEEAEEHLETGSSKSSKIKGIRKHRSNEKADLRESESKEFELIKDDHTDGGLAEIMPIRAEVDENFSYPSHMELLRKKQMERKKKNDE